MGVVERRKYPRITFENPISTQISSTWADGNECDKITFEDGEIIDLSLGGVKIKTRDIQEFTINVNSVFSFTFLIMGTPITKRALVRHIVNNEYVLYGSEFIKGNSMLDNWRYIQVLSKLELYNHNRQNSILDE